MEQAIKITARIYKCRDSAKSLCKMQNADYKETLKPYTEIIETVMKSKNLKPIQAILAISKTKTYNDSGMAQMLFMASLAEILEPSV